jgi:hypothetical protein
MFLSHEQLKQALAALHEARRQGGRACREPRVDAQGRSERQIQPPKRRDGRQATAFTLDYGAHGALVRQTNKGLAGTLTDSGGLVKQTSKLLAGTLTSSGALAALKTVLKALAGTLTSSGAILRQVGKGAGGTVGPVGTCARFIAHALGGALTSAGAFTYSLNGVITTPPINLGARSLASSLGASLRRLTSSLGTPTRRGTGSGPQGQS